MPVRWLLWKKFEVLVLYKTVVTLVVTILFLHCAAGFSVAERSWDIDPSFGPAISSSLYTVFVRSNGYIADGSYCQFGSYPPDPAFDVTISSFRCILPQALSPMNLSLLILDMTHGVLQTGLVFTFHAMPVIRSSFPAQGRIHEAQRIWVLGENLEEAVAPLRCGFRLEAVDCPPTFTYAVKSLKASADLHAFGKEGNEQEYFCEVPYLGGHCKDRVMPKDTLLAVSLALTYDARHFSNAVHFTYMEFQGDAAAELLSNDRDQYDAADVFTEVSEEVETQVYMVPTTPMFSTEETTLVTTETASTTSVSPSESESTFVTTTNTTPSSTAVFLETATVRSVSMSAEESAPAHISATPSLHLPSVFESSHHSESPTTTSSPSPLITASSMASPSAPFDSTLETLSSHELTPSPAPTHIASASLDFSPLPEASTSALSSALLPPTFVTDTLPEPSLSLRPSSAPTPLTDESELVYETSEIVEISLVFESHASPLPSSPASAALESTTVVLVLTEEHSPIIASLVAASESQPSTSPPPSASFLTTEMLMSETHDNPSTPSASETVVEFTFVEETEEETVEFSAEAPSSSESQKVSFHDVLSESTLAFDHTSLISVVSCAEPCVQATSAHATVESLRFSSSVPVEASEASSATFVTLLTPHVSSVTLHMSASHEASEAVSETEQLFPPSDHSLEDFTQSYTLPSESPLTTRYTLSETAHASVPPSARITVVPTLYEPSLASESQLAQSTHTISATPSHAASSMHVETIMSFVDQTSALETATLATFAETESVTEPSASFSPAFESQPSSPSIFVPATSSNVPSSLDTSGAPAIDSPSTVEASFSFSPSFSVYESDVNPQPPTVYLTSESDLLSSTTAVAGTEETQSDVFPTATFTVPSLSPIESPSPTQTNATHTFTPAPTPPSITPTHLTPIHTFTPSPTNASITPTVLNATHTPTVFNATHTPSGITATVSGTPSPSSTCTLSQTCTASPADTSATPSPPASTYTPTWSDEEATASSTDSPSETSSFTQPFTATPATVSPSNTVFFTTPLTPTFTPTETPRPSPSEQTPTPSPSASMTATSWESTPSPSSLPTPTPPTDTPSSCPTCALDVCGVCNGDGTFCSLSNASGIVVGRIIGYPLYVAPQALKNVIFPVNPSVSLDLYTYPVFDICSYSATGTETNGTYSGSFGPPLGTQDVVFGAWALSANASSAGLRCSVSGAGWYAPVIVASLPDSSSQVWYGCDGVPYSLKVVDICGICGGDNNSCLAVASTFSLTSIFPAYGTMAGRTPVTVFGSNLTDASSAYCRFGDAAPVAASFRSSDASYTCTSPPAPSGTVSVYLILSLLKSAVGLDFTFIDVGEITSIEPWSLRTSQDTQLHISASNATDTGQSLCRFRAVQPPTNTLWTARARFNSSSGTWTCAYLAQTVSSDAVFAVDLSFNANDFTSGNAANLIYFVYSSSASATPLPEGATQSLVINVRLNANFSEFNVSSAELSNQLAELLNISSSLVSVAGLREGSVIVDYKCSSDANDSSTSLQDLQLRAQTALSHPLASIGGASVLDLQMSVEVVVPVVTSTSTSSSGLTAAKIGGIVAGAVVFMMIVICLGFFIRTRLSHRNTVTADPEDSDFFDFRNRRPSNKRHVSVRNTDGSFYYV